MRGETRCCTSKLISNSDFSETRHRLRPCEIPDAA